MVCILYTVLFGASLLLRRFVAVMWTEFYLFFIIIIISFFNRLTPSALIPACSIQLYEHSEKAWYECWQLHATLRHWIGIKRMGASVSLGWTQDIHSTPSPIFCLVAKKSERKREGKRTIRQWAR